MVQASLAPLAIGIAADFFVVVQKVSGSRLDGAIVSAALLLGMLGLWWGVPWCWRRA